MINRLMLWLGLPHWYLSTGCLHGGRDLTADGHRHCQSSSGAGGFKRPGTCKFCGVNCRCRCHRGHRWGPAKERSS